MLFEICEAKVLVSNHTLNSCMIGDPGGWVATRSGGASRPSVMSKWLSNANEPHLLVYMVQTLER